MSTTGPIREDVTKYLTRRGRAWLGELEWQATVMDSTARTLHPLDPRRYLRLAECRAIEMRIQHGRWGEAHARLVNAGFHPDTEVLRFDPSDPCDRPPSGWRCTRSAMHAGPCAAYPTGGPDA